MAKSISPTVAQQVFTVGSGVAGGLAGFVLASQLSDVEDVPVSGLAVGTIVSFIATFGAAFLITSAAKNDEQQAAT